MSIERLKKKFGDIRGYVSKYFSKPWVVCLSTLILMAFILFCRKPDAFFNPQFWAEDGVIFFKQNFDYGLKSLIMPYAGYLHTAPRIVAFIASWFPVSMTPAIYNFFALAVTLLPAVAIFNSRCFIPFKPLVALSIVLVPHFGEVFMNITSAHWYLCLLLLILFCMDPPTRIHQYILDYLIVIICGLTGPFIIFLFPVFFVKLFIKKSYYNLVMLLVALLCVLIQGWFIIHTLGNYTNTYPFNADALINFVGIKFFGRLFFVKYIYKEIPPSIMAILAVLFPVALIYFSESKKQKYLILLFLYMGFTITASTLYKFKGIPDFLAYTIDGGDRYFYIPYLMIIWSLAVYLVSKNVLKRQIATVLIILILISSAQYFRSLKYVDFHWKQYSEKIEKGIYIVVPINPSGWYLALGSPENKPDNIIDPNINDI